MEALEASRKSHILTTQADKRHVDDLGATLNELCGAGVGEGYEGTPGFVYVFPNGGSVYLYEWKGQYVAPISNDEWTNADIRLVEARLYDFAHGEGLITGGYDEDGNAPQFDCSKHGHSTITGDCDLGGNDKYGN